MRTSDVLGALLTAGAVSGALLAVTGLLWWLVSPRIARAVEQACERSLGRTVERVAAEVDAHDERLRALELATSHQLSPASLVELAELVQLVHRYAPEANNRPAPPAPQQRVRGTTR